MYDRSRERWNPARRRRWRQPWRGWGRRSGGRSAGAGAGGGAERLLADVTSVLFLTSPLAVGTATYVYARSEVRT